MSAPVTTKAPPKAPAYWPTDAMSEWAMCERIASTLNTSVGHENGDEVACQLVDLNSLLGTSAGVLARLFHRKEAAKLAVLEAIDTKLPASLQRDLVNAKCANYVAAHEFAERLNSALVHSIDALRSVLSWLKLEKGQQGN